MQTNGLARRGNTRAGSVVAAAGPAPPRSRRLQLSRARSEEGTGGRLDAEDKGARASWPVVKADLHSLTETKVEQDGKRFLSLTWLQTLSRISQKIAVCDHTVNKGNQ